MYGRTVPWMGAKDGQLKNPKANVSWGKQPAEQRCYR